MQLPFSEILIDGVVLMAEGTTFSMKEARGRYFAVSALLVFFTSLFGFFPIAIIISAALQACLFRLSRPSILAFLPAVIILPLLFVLYGIESALILTFVLLAVGVILRMAQKKNVGKNVTVASMTAVFLVAVICAFSLWLWKQNALSVEGLRLFLEKFQELVMTELRAWFENAGTNASISSEEIETLLDVTNQSLSDTIILLPSILTVFFFGVSCAVIGLYKIICRLFKMKDGLSEKNWHFSVSMPFAAFYLFLLILAFFISGESAFFIMSVNLRVLLTVFIAIVGVSMLVTSLSNAFPRISTRVFGVLAIIFLCFSTYSVLVWQIIAAVTAVKVIIAAFRKPTQEES